MITVPTVLVMGAGASIDFGFPSGWELFQDIAHKAEHDWPVLADISPMAGDLKRFAQALTKSGQCSVDSFLERREDLVEIGKRAIALALIPKEREISLFSESTTKGWLPRMSWYRHLFQKMDCRPGDFHANNISFITYNYDRSLEHFLTTALASNYRITHDAAWKAVMALNIIHVHGQLGAYSPIGSGNGRLYTDTFSPHELSLAAAGIQVIHEHNDTTKIDATRKLLKNAKRICFLGFGYDLVSLERLETKQLPLGIDVVGSCYKIPDSKKSSLGNIIPNIRWADPARLCLDVLQNEFPLV